MIEQDGQQELLVLFAGDAARAEAAAAWLDRLGQWTGSRPTDRRVGIACDVVRGIVYVDSPEWTAAVRWALGEPDVAEWRRALQLYGPVIDESTPRGRADMSARAYNLTQAVANGDQRAARDQTR